MRRKLSKRIEGETIMANNKRTNAIMFAVANNSALHDTLVEIHREAQKNGLSMNDYADKFLEALTKEGIEATKEDIVEYLSIGEEVDLSDDELDNVAGGGCFFDSEGRVDSNGCWSCEKYCG